MKRTATRSVCSKPTWNKNGMGMERLLLGDGFADSTLLALSEANRPFRLTYRLRWDDKWHLREGTLTAASRRFERGLTLVTDGRGHVRDQHDRRVARLDGRLDIDSWPTPFTNTFPIRRERLLVSERREIRLAWVFARDLTVKAQITQPSSARGSTLPYLGLRYPNFSREA